MACLLVVMGVSSCGKSTVAAALARCLQLQYVEGDELHSAANIARMRSGVALTDADRRDWLDALAGHLQRAQRQQMGVAMACSALRRSYRDILRRGVSELLFVHLRGSPALLAQRSAQRAGHYMPASLLQSQFEILEAPQADERALEFEVEQPPETIVQAVVAEIARRSAIASAT